MAESTQKDYNDFVALCLNLHSKEIDELKASIKELSEKVQGLTRELEEVREELHPYNEY